MLEKMQQKGYKFVKICKLFSKIHKHVKRSQAIYFKKALKMV